DVYFKQRIYGSAGEWFARAIQIDRNRETAYRYWGDALTAAGKNDEARAKFMEAIVAEPYSRSAWQGVAAWADKNGVKLNFVQLQDKSELKVKDDKNVEITIDSESLQRKDDPTSSAWMTYAIGRASWHTEKFKKEFPNEPEYRRTMKEEADAFRLMVTVLKEQKDFKKTVGKLDPGLQEVIRIEEAGL